MTHKDYVNYDAALKLKAAGFDEPCDYYYQQGTLMYYPDTAQINRNTNGHGRENKCSAPSLWHAQKWLREKKGLHISVFPDKDSWLYCIIDIAIVRKNEGGTFNAQLESKKGGGIQKSYESALAAGISTALNLINPKEQ